MPASQYGSSRLLPYREVSPSSRSGYCFATPRYEKILQRFTLGSRTVERDSLWGARCCPGWVIRASESTEKDLKVSLAVQQADLQAVKPEAKQETQVWGIVISADKTLQEAASGIKHARDLEFQAVMVYDRQNWLRSAVEFSNLSEAQAALPSLQSGVRNSAYLVNLSKWCPAYRDRGDGVKTCEGF